jgi:hypothetical protein
MYENRLRKTITIKTGSTDGYMNTVKWNMPEDVIAEEEEEEKDAEGEEKDDMMII